MGDYSELFAAAQLAFVKENYSKVIDMCKQIPLSDTLGIDALSLAGNAYLVQSQFKEAEAFFIKAIEIEPRVGLRYFDYGNSLFGQQRLTEATEQYAKAIQLGCGNEVLKKIHYICGVINQVSGKSTEALINFDKSDAIAGSNTDQTDILLKRIQIYVEQNNFEKAENCALQLKLLVPNEFKSYQLLFQLYLEQRKTGEASAVLDEAIAYCGDTPDVLTEIEFDRAMLCCFQAEQEPEQEEAHYQNALEILSRLEHADSVKHSDQCEATVTKADIFLKLNRFDEARALAESVTQEALPELKEYVERANYILVKCCSHKKNFSGVQEYAGKLKESDNLFYRHYGYYAEAYAAKQIAGTSPVNRSTYMDLYNLAIAYYKNCTVSMPGDFLAFLYRAKCYVDIGKFEKAEELSRILPEDAQKTLQDYINQERRGWNQ